MAQKQKDGTLRQPTYEDVVRLSALRPADFKVKSKKDGTVDLRIKRFNGMELSINLQDEWVCEELARVAEEARRILRKKRKKGRLV
jgi:hypothetical protein